MDRTLLSGAFGLFLILVAYLMADLGLLKVVPFQTARPADAIAIGTMQRTEQEVRRRSNGSIVWDESSPKDVLYQFDSVLTLKNSAALLRLQGETTLNLDENTLVVLEPSEMGRSESLRLRFSRGTLRSRSGRPLAVQGETWTVETGAGAEISLKSLEDGQVELEIEKGRATVTPVGNSSDTPGSTQELAAGQRMMIEKTGVGAPVTVTTELKWIAELPGRVYAHDFPLDYELKWQGSAHALRVIHPDKKIEVFELNGLRGGSLASSAGSSIASHALRLSPGTYHFNLKNSAGDLSPTHTVQIRPAQAFRYYSPLPRDRVKTGDETLFSWEANSQARRYQLQMTRASDSPAWDGPVSISAETSRVRAAWRDNGVYLWRVIGLDEENYQIPSRRVYPLHSVARPLQAPVLNVPDVREPSSLPRDSKREPPGGESSDGSSGEPAEGSSGGGAATDSRNGAFLIGFRNRPSKKAIRLLSLLSARAWAEAALTLEVEFSWAPVPDADHYIIEIAERADFEKPLVTRTVKSTKFIWHDLKKGIYFWRVAGGRRDGTTAELGYFSAPMAADLQRLQAGVPNPGVTVRSSVAPVRAVKPTREIATRSDERDLHRAESAARPTKDPIAESAAELPTAEAPASSEPRPSTDTTTTATVSAAVTPTTDATVIATPIWQGALWWRPSYASIRNDIEGGGTSSFIGAVPVSFGLDVSLPSSFGSGLTVFTRYESVRWKRQPVESYPFQEDLQDWRFRAQLFLERESRPWSLGLASERHSFLKRLEHEQVGFESAWLVGPAVLWRKWSGTRYLRSQARLIYGDGTFGSSIEGDLSYRIWSGPRAHVMTGVGLEGGWFNHGALTSQELTGVLQLGISW